jgi:hypothetical protein
MARGCILIAPSHPNAHKSYEPYGLRAPRDPRFDRYRGPPPINRASAPKSTRTKAIRCGGVSKKSTGKRMRRTELELLLEAAGPLKLVTGKRTRYARGKYAEERLSKATTVKEELGRKEGMASEVLKEWKKEMGRKEGEARIVRRCGGVKYGRGKRAL